MITGSFPRNLGSQWLVFRLVQKIHSASALIVFPAFVFSPGRMARQRTAVASCLLLAGAAVTSEAARRSSSPLASRTSLRPSARIIRWRMRRPRACYRRGRGRYGLAPTSRGQTLNRCPLNRPQHQVKTPILLKMFPTLLSLLLKFAHPVETNQSVTQS